MESIPTGRDILAKAVEQVPVSSLNPDQRFLNRRACEYELFESIEHACYFPVISKGFGSMKEFMGLAQLIGDIY